MITGTRKSTVEGWLTIQATVVRVDANALVMQTEQLCDENIRSLWAERGRRSG